MADTQNPTAVVVEPESVQATPVVEPESNQNDEVDLTADDAHDDDADSALGVGSIASSTTSIGSSILKHRQENGRTYHAYKEGKYFLPNDETENDRLDLQNHIYLIMREGKLTTTEFAKDFPIHNVLDVGTGTGIWAIDFADEHPETKVLGMDLSPSQPNFLPPNCVFEIDDIDEPWTYSQKFDFIHSRQMTGSIKDWPRFFEQAFEFTNPGGYIELSDMIAPCICDDGTMPKDSKLKAWSEYLLEASAKSGSRLDSGKFYRAKLEKAGWTDIKCVVSPWPMNTWPKDKKLKELGAWQLENFSTGCAGVSMALFTRFLGWTAQEVDIFSIEVKKEMKDTRIHAYWDIYTWTARKPL